MGLFGLSFRFYWFTILSRKVIDACGICELRESEAVYLANFATFHLRRLFAVLCVQKADKLKPGQRAVDSNSCGDCFLTLISVC